LVTLLILLSPGLLLALAYFFVPVTQRRTIAALSTVMFAAAILFIVAVNTGWVSP
jgi:hypothetical protein